MVRASSQLVLKISFRLIRNKSLLELMPTAAAPTTSPKPPVATTEIRFVKLDRIGLQLMLRLL